MMRMLLCAMLASFCSSGCTSALEGELQGGANRRDPPATSASHAPPAAPQRASTGLKGPYAASFGYTVMGVPDIDQALALWESRFGMEIVDRRRGADPALARVWGRHPDAIVDQALLTSPGLIDGGIHLVEFAGSRASSEQASTTPAHARGAVHVAVRDIQARHGELEAAGLRMRSGVEPLRAGEQVVRATRATAHGVLDIVIFEQRGATWPMSRQGYAVSPHVSFGVADLDAEVEFLTRALGLEVLEQRRYAGPAAEAILGMAPGAAAEARLLGGADSRFGRIELLQGARTGGVSRSTDSSATPASLGLLSLTYVVPDLMPMLERIGRIPVTEHGHVRSVLGEGRMLSIVSPAGLRIDIIEQ